MSVRTEKAILQVSFSKEKLEALKFYMDEKDTTVEKELQAHIKSVYEKYVPAATRRYFDRNDSAEDLQAEVTVGASAEQQDAVVTSPQNRGRRRNAREQEEVGNQSVQTENSSIVEGNSEQTEESQGMSMSM